MSKKKQVYRGREREVYELHVNDHWTYDEIAEKFGGARGGAIEAKKRYAKGVKEHAPLVTALASSELTDQQKAILRNVQETNEKRAEFGSILDEIRDVYMERFRNNPDSVSKSEMRTILKTVAHGNNLLKSIDESLKVNFQFINKGSITINPEDNRKAREMHERDVYRAKQEGLMLSERFIRQMDVWDEYTSFMDGEARAAPRSADKSRTVDVEFTEID